MRNKQQRRWLIRIFAVLLGLSPFFMLEAALRIGGWSIDATNQDPFIDLHLLEPLFVKDLPAGVYRIPDKRMRLFQPAEFPIAKPSGTFRIFCLGGSTTQGEPYKPDTAFPKWLELDLKARAPDRNWEVINCGGLSYASYRVRAILQEILNYSPDLVVVYTGQNEFLEDRQYGQWRRVPEQWSGVASTLYRLRTVQLAASLFNRNWSTRTLSEQSSGETGPAAAAEQTKPTLPSEVDALLDYEGGLSSYHRDQDWAEPIESHFEWNLKQMVADCRAAQVPMILCNPVVNLKDCPPMKFEFDSQATPDVQAKSRELWEQAQANRDSPAETMRLLQALQEIDPGHSGAWYFLGQLQLESGEWEPARRSLVAAKDFDVCPLRATSNIQNIVREVARETSTPLVDADALFTGLSQHGIVGKRWLVDHVHPTIEGHQVIADAIANEMVTMHWASAQQGWQTRRTEAFRSHLGTLGEDYFLRGKQRLEGLLRWTQGRANKVRPPARSDN